MDKAHLSQSGYGRYIPNIAKHILFALVQIQDKDASILSHLVDIRVVNLRDDADASTSHKHDKDEGDEEEEEGPKVHMVLCVQTLGLSIPCTL